MMMYLVVMGLDESKLGVRLPLGFQVPGLPHICGRDGGIKNRDSRDGGAGREWCGSNNTPLMVRSSVRSNSMLPPQRRLLS